ncbi:calpain-13 isoform X1 [Pelobates cultripes]|uniref:Calpain-13 isoform X1 n=2 Tax=Pelobates cultripes TaxID=61616 RepID=A0AAD1RHQ9_PELCU|nr:calpain-13 isoform X1 [Pelobates cultripes]
MPMPGVFKKVAEGQQLQRTVGTVDNPKRFRGQDFNSIRESCLSRRQLFEDDTFPASLTSIGQQLLPKDKLLSIKWKRPNTANRDPRFLLDGASIFDIVQGEVGDCWVLAAVGSLTLHRKFLEDVIPKDQEFTYKYVGIFHFRFWQFGEWVDVVVDDRLPTLNGKYLSVQPRSNNEFWPSLLEKAYAKLRGSYQNLHWGFISEALVDFTGGIQMDFILTKPPVDLRDIVLAAAKSGSLVGSTTPGGQQFGNVELQNGLVRGHAYTVTNATQLTCKDLSGAIACNNRTEDIVQVWNPWGQGEWNGRWSDNSPQWERVSPEIRSKLNVQRNDGEFWMSCQDFIQNYNQLNICNYTPSYLDFESPQFIWKSSSYFNQWVRGSTAGGCSTADDIWKNPQYVINVLESEGDKRCYNVAVALMQGLSNERKYNPPWLRIGFAFCRVGSKGVKNGSQQKYSRQQVIETINSGLERSREITRSFMAPPGTYVIIPFTEIKGQESEFLLRIFTKTKEIEESSSTQPDLREDSSASFPSDTPSKNNYSKSVPSNVTSTPYSNGTLSNEIDSRNTMPTPKAVLKRYQDFNYENIFYRYANQRSEMYAEDLQKLLNDVIITDQTFVADRGDFTLDACRGILILMDLNANGRLSLDEFGRLWKRLNLCKDLFRSIDVNQTGFIDAFGLKKAVQETGLTVSDDVLSVMVMRYADSTEKMIFSDFVCCMIRLGTVTGVFKNLTRDGRGLYLTGEQWMQMVMSS